MQGNGIKNGFNENEILFMRGISIHPNKKHFDSYLEKLFLEIMFFFLLCKKNYKVNLYNIN